MNYTEMTTSDIKRKLIEVMSERESIHYVKGWLQQCYVCTCDEEIERAVAIKQLEQYGF
jgi:hypothetical protein